jgi:glutamate-1-semialdehyde 2,1-aminomutase
MPTPGRYEKSQALFRRAQRLIPGGFHLSGRPLLDPERAPLYMERGRGSRIWDADGHEYIDFVMAYGPFLLGYAHPEVDRAAIEQISRGSLLSMNHPMHLRFVERLVARFPGAEMGAFFKTGSEATTAALRVARRLTGRRKVARCGYHGWHDWCLPLEDFVPAGLDAQVLEFRAANPATLDALFDAQPKQIAAVIVAPEMVLSPQRETFARLIETTHRHGAVFIMDEVKTAFRIAPGSMQQRLGVIADLTTVSKALGNGWPIAALVGKRDVMKAGAGMHYSATFHGDTAPMAAALAVLDILDRRDPVDIQSHVWRLGERLIAGLDEIARRHGVPAEAYGEPLPPMPFLRFTHPDPAVNDTVRSTFYAEVLARGVLLHPRHLWFISAAHSDEDVARALAAADEAMAAARISGGF